MDGDETAQPTLGDLIRAARLAAGWSQADLAERVGRSQEWMTKVETGRIPTPRDESLRRLAAVLGLNLPDLFVAMNRARTAREGERIADAAFVVPWSEEPQETFTFRTNDPDLKRVLAKLQRVDMDRRRDHDRPCVTTSAKTDLAKPLDNAYQRIR